MKGLKYLFKNIWIIYILSLSLLLFIKIFTLTSILENLGENKYYIITQVFSHDSIIFFLIILLTYLSYLKNIHKFLGIILRIIALIIFIIYVVDYFVLTYFFTHLTIIDIIKYSNYTYEFLSQTSAISFLQSLLIIIFFSFFSLYFLYKKYYIKKVYVHLSFNFILFFLFFSYVFLAKENYIHSWIFKNYIDYNKEIIGKMKEYKKAYKNNEKIICTKSQTHNKNVIILMVESLASYQSNFFSGIKNWTPNLDEIATNNISLTNFYSNGFTTEDAEISILTGELPLYTPKLFSNANSLSFNGFYNIPNSLPNIFKKNNYNTEFITSSDLNFSNTKAWTKSIGFQHIEGSEVNYYKNKKRYHFNSVADEYLFEQVINRIKKQNSKYFLFIKTVSSHVPFINPENDLKSEENTIKYVDKQIGKFYHRLKKLNFFENGILIITGDHHPMISIKKEEITRFGVAKASAKVPLILINKNKKDIIKSQFSHTNIYDSIKNYLSENSCTSEFKGNFIEGQVKAPKYIIRKKGDKRNIISVFENENIYNIKLNGDKTKIIEDKSNKKIINKINFIRSTRGSTD